MQDIRPNLFEWLNGEEQIKVLQVKELSEFLETDLDEITIEKIANHCSFENLKNVRTFDLSARLKESDNSILLKIMRVSYFLSKILLSMILQTSTVMLMEGLLCWFLYLSKKSVTNILKLSPS